MKQPVSSGGSGKLFVVLAIAGSLIGLLGVGVAVAIAVLVWMRGSNDPQPNPRSVAEQAADQASLEAPTVDADEQTAGGEDDTVAAAAPPESTVVTTKPVDTPAAKPRERTDQIDLTYGWTQGDEHHYRMRIKADHGGKVEDIEVWCNYYVGEPALSGAEPEAATGTGFVVARNGYLVTCAHVVEDAAEVKVTLGDKEYDATVIDSNLGDDLALLHIPANNLSPITLADSENAKLAQAIRVVGFPMTSVLGEGLKITGGSIAGFVDEGEGRRFQIDAAINPGNSGGPVINDRGQVVGVASAKLMGIEVSKVGFAVPSNRARTLLAENGIDIAAATTRSPLSGPQLAELVKPATALIEVTTGANSRNQYQLKFEGAFYEYVNVQPTRPSFSRRGTVRQKVETKEQGPMRVSDSGKVAQFEGKKHLPYVLGPIGLFFLEDLNNHGQRRWGSETQTELHIIERSQNSGSGPRGFPRSPPSILGPRHHFDPFGRRPQATEKVKEKIPAVERTRYEIEGEDELQINIKKTYEFRTLDDPDDPYMLIKGSGNLVFDKKRRVPKSLDYNGTLQRSTESVTIRLPMQISYELRDLEVVAEERRKREEETARRNAEAARKKKEAEERAAEAKRIAETPLTSEETAQALADLRSGDRTRIVNQLNALAKKSLADSDTNISDAIQALLTHESGDVKKAADQALLKWSSKHATKRKLDGAYAQSHPMGSNGKTITANTYLPVGLIVQFRYYPSHWFAGQIVEALPDGKVKVKGRGFGGQTHTVPRSQVQLPPEELTQPNLTPDQVAKVYSNNRLFGKVRTWTDRGGRTVEAEFRGFADGKVQLRRKTDDQDFELPLTQLSDLDRELIEMGAK